MTSATLLVGPFSHLEKAVDNIHNFVLSEKYMYEVDIAIMVDRVLNQQMREGGGGCPGRPFVHASLTYVWWVCCYC